MVMQVNGNYDHSGNDYAEKVKEKQAAQRAEQAKEAEKATEKAAEGKSSGKLSQPQDEYISSEKSGKKPTGLYRVEQDGNGSRRIYFDDPKAAREKAVHPEGRESLHAKEAPGAGESLHAKEALGAGEDLKAKEEPEAGEDLRAKEDRSREGKNGKDPKVSGNSQGEPEEKCVVNTDKVDREIKKLKEKKQQLEQQIQSANGDEKKIRELEKKLAQVENELSQKDNDTYRRQHASVSE